MERVEAALKQGMYAAYFDDRKSALHRLLTARLGKAAELYHIRLMGKRPGTCYQLYALPLKPPQIVLGELDTVGVIPFTDVEIFQGRYYTYVEEEADRIQAAVYPGSSL